MTNDQITRIKHRARVSRYDNSPKGLVAREYKNLRRRSTCTPLRPPEYPRLSPEQLRREVNKMVQQQYDELVLHGLSEEDARRHATEAAREWARKQKGVEA